MIQKIAIIGGGFAGYNFAKRLMNNTNFEITLIDKNNYTFFPPLLYQVATGFLEASNISYPFRKLIQNKKNIFFKQGEVLEIVPEENKIILSTGEVKYDKLIIATGTKTNYFGNQQIEQNAIPMKTINDALEMRNYILKQLEHATTISSNDEELKKLLTFVIAGGGPTGVEISGMLAEMRHSIFKKDYPELKDKIYLCEINLIDGGPSLLAPMSKFAQENTYKSLEKLGVKIILNTTVNQFDGHEITLNNGNKILSNNLIWAAGVHAQKYKGLNQESFGRGNRLIVDQYNKVLASENIYAIGDTCIQTHEEKFTNGHPQVAQVAIQQGKNLANNFINEIKHKNQVAFKYKDKGSMAIIGRNKAVADIPPRFHFKGFFAWLIWIFIHLMSLIHFRNKIYTLYNWITAYFTKDQALRLIIRPNNELKNHT